jgi:hypothetical protein
MEQRENDQHFYGRYRDGDDEKHRKRRVWQVQALIDENKR